MMCGVGSHKGASRQPTRDHAKRQMSLGHVEAAQEGHVLLPARGEAVGGEGVVEGCTKGGGGAGGGRGRVEVEGL